MSKAAAAVLLLPLLACSPSAPLKASYCAVVAAHHTADRASERRLSSLVEEFTRANGFTLPGGHQPDTDEYENAVKHVLLDVTFGMGDAGAVITLFYQGHDGDDLKPRLDAFLMSRVDPVLKVRKCSDVPGFETPRMVR